MPMAVVWTQIASAASRLCEPSKPSANEMERSKSQLQDEVEQLQSVLEETRYMLSHEQRLVQELKAQLKELTTKQQREQRSMQDQLDNQCIEIERLRSQLEKAAALRHQKKEALEGELQDNKASENVKFDVCKAHESEKELLAALLEHARIQVSARENSNEEASSLLELRTELEEAQRKASEEQRAAEELREQLKNEENARRELEGLHALQTSCYMRDFHHNRMFRADVTEFLQKLGQRYPGIAKELVTASAEPVSPYGAGGG